MLCASIVATSEEPWFLIYMPFGIRKGFVFCVLWEIALSQQNYHFMQKLLLAAPSNTWLTGFSQGYLR